MEGKSDSKLRSSNKKNTFIFNLKGLHPEPLSSSFILINSKMGDMQFSLVDFSLFLIKLFRSLVHFFLDHASFFDPTREKLYCLIINIINEFHTLNDLLFYLL
jgi:hypothetical protein